MPLFRNKYRVETTRLKHWDYAAPGFYFVTICTRGRELFLGNITKSKMMLSPIGGIARQCWDDIPTHFPNCRLDARVIMPNHIHGIIVLVETRHGASLPGASPRGASPRGASPRGASPPGASPPGRFGPLQSGSLPAIINAYKGSVKRRCNQNGFGDFAWQPRFYDHVIRGESELHRIRQYIANNPAKWEQDRNNVHDVRR